MDRTLLVVTGAGRSGTSTLAGTLAQLGLHVPGPYKVANTANPRGFYESTWVVRFNSRLLRSACVKMIDGRPEAAGIISDAILPRHRERLASWLAEVSEGHQVTVVKDPRTTWLVDLWAQAAVDVGLSPAFAMMLRHPAEVVGSRETHYYATKSEGADREGFAVRNLAGWVNAVLVAERATRGQRRCLVRYDDLLGHWRPTLAKAATHLGLPLETGGAAGRRVERFIEPDLSRHRRTWSDLEMDEHLRSVAERAWKSADRLADDPNNLEAQTELDNAAAHYAHLYLTAERLAVDHTLARVAQVRRAAERGAQRRDASARWRSLPLRWLRSGGAKRRSVSKPPPTPAPGG
jgi:hypothetical protein